ncbi:8653_t:CDS:2, partial [Cetraspora pellucida]
YIKHKYNENESQYDIFEDQQKFENSWSDLNNEENEENTFSIQFTEEENRSTNYSQDTFVNPNVFINFEIILLILLISLSHFSIIFVWIFGFLLLWRMKFIIRKLKLTNRDYVIEMNPFEIMFSQSTINNIFQMGNDIENTIKDLIDKAIKRGLNITKIPVKIQQITDLNIEWKLEGLYKIVHNNNFKNIIVSKFARNERIIEEDEY